MRFTPDKAINAKTTDSQPTPGFMALHFACDGSDKKLKGKLGLLKQLLERSADIDAKDAKGSTPLLVAAGQGLTDACEVLIETGCDKFAVDNDSKGAIEKAQVVRQTW